jgi:hypothetical protein
MKLSDGAVWLSAKNCQSGDVIEIMDEGQWIDSTRFTYDDGNPVRQLVFKVKHNGEEKKLTLIKPSRQAMIEAFGDDTIEWVGKQAIIELALNTQGGKSIMLKPIGTENSAPDKKDLPF